MIDILPGNKKKGTEDIKIRVIEVISIMAQRISCNEPFDPSITQKMFQELYFYRWPVETKIQGIERLSRDRGIFWCNNHFCISGILYQSTFF